MRSSSAAFAVLGTGHTELIHFFLRRPAVCALCDWPQAGKPRLRQARQARASRHSDRAQCVQGAERASCSGASEGAPVRDDVRGEAQRGLPRGGAQARAQPRVQQHREQQARQPRRVLRARLPGFHGAPPTCVPDRHSQDTRAAVFSDLQSDTTFPARVCGLRSSPRLQLEAIPSPGNVARIASRSLAGHLRVGEQRVGVMVRKRLDAQAARGDHGQAAGHALQHGHACARAQPRTGARPGLRGATGRRRRAAAAAAAATPAGAAPWLY